MKISTRVNKLNVSRFPGKALGPVLICLSLPLIASANDPGEYSEGGLGAGLHLNLNTRELQMTGAGTIQGTYAALGTGSSAPIGVAQGNLIYNVAGVSQAGESTRGTTGLRVRANLFAGYSPRETGDPCGIYTGGHAMGSVQGFVNADYGNRANLTLGTEVGLLCRVRDTVVLIAPTAGIGFYSASSPFTSSPRGLPRASTFLVGGMLRISVSDLLYIQAQYGRGISAVDSTDNPSGHGGEVDHASVGAVVDIGERWSILGEFELDHYEANGSTPDHVDAVTNVFAIYRFSRH